MVTYNKLIAANLILSPLALLLFLVHISAHSSCWSKISRIIMRFGLLVSLILQIVFVDIIKWLNIHFHKSGCIWLDLPRSIPNRPFPLLNDSSVDINAPSALQTLPLTLHLLAQNLNIGSDWLCIFHLWSLAFKWLIKHHSWSVYTLRWIYKSSGFIVDWVGFFGCAGWHVIKLLLWLVRMHLINMLLLVGSLSTGWHSCFTHA